MAHVPMTAREYIQWVFSPHIGVLCDEESDNTCLRNHLKFTDLLQPFCTLKDDVGISDPQGSLVTMHHLRIVLQDISSKPPSPAIAKRILSTVVTSNVPPPGQDNGAEDAPSPWYEKWKEVFHQSLHPFDHEFTKHFLACIIVVSSSHGARAGEEALKLSQQQHQQQHQPSQHSATKYPKWFAPNILKYYLVLHDASLTSKELGDAAYQSISKSPSVVSCHILTINSGRPADSQPLPSYWLPHTLLHATVPGYTRSSVGGSECSSSPASPCEDYAVTMGGGFSSPPPTTTTPPGDADLPPSTTHILPTPDHPLSPTLPSMDDDDMAAEAEDFVVNVGEVFSNTGTEWGAMLSVGDVDNIRQFVGSFVRGALVPHVERQVRGLTDIVANRSRSKSLLSATRRWLGGSKNPSQSTSNSVLYANEAAELQTRRLADLAFMFAMYDVAYNNYHTAKNDFKSDQAWLYFAGAQEMAAFALYMQNSSELHKRYLESTWETLSAVCKANSLGIRLLLIACEVLKSNRSYGEAAVYYIKLTSEESDLLSALMLEQAAACFLKAGQISGLALRRKFAFHMTLAAHRYSKAGQKQLSLRANILASKVYNQGGLTVAEDHILYNVGKYSGQLKLYEPALNAYTRLVDARSRAGVSTKQTANQQTAYLREFLALYKIIENGHAKLRAGTETGVGDGTAATLPQLPELPVPWLLPLESMLLLDSSNAPIYNSSDKELGVLAASGVTFSNSQKEHSEAWAGLARLVVENVFESSAKPVATQLLTPETDNTRSPQLAVHEPCWLKLPVINPLLIGFTIREARLIYKFLSEGDEQAESIGEFSLMNSVTEHISIMPKEKKDLVFELSSSKLGQIFIESLEYKLSLTSDSGGNTLPHPANLPIITGSQAIKVKGPRLNNNIKNRSSVTYAADMRLELTVVPPLPRVRVTFSEIPQQMMSGQMVSIDVAIKNIGPIPITGLYLAIADPKHVFFVLGNEKDSLENSAKLKYLNSSIKTRNNSSLSRNGPEFSYLQCLSNTGDDLGIGMVIRGTLWVKGQQQPGTQDLMLLFYCHTPDAQHKYRYRLLRHHSLVTVTASAGLRVSAASSCSVPHASDSVPPVVSAAGGSGGGGGGGGGKGIENPPLDTRLAITTTPTAVHNISNITVDITVAGQLNTSPATTIKIFGISCHSSNWKLRHFSGVKPTGAFVLSSGESLKTVVQCYAMNNNDIDDANVQKGANFSTKNDFSFVSFCENSKNDCDNNPVSIISKEFSIRTRVELAELTSEASIPSPVADVAAPERHPALVQYNNIKAANQLDLVLTLIWQSTLASGITCYGQHSVLLHNIGDTVNIPISVAPNTSSLTVSPQEMKPPVRIIPLEPPVLPQIPSNFATSVGLDMSAGSHPGQALPEGLSVMQATELAEDGEMTVTEDLSKEQLENSIKVSAVLPSKLQHNFTQIKLCRVSVSVVVHNCTGTAMTAQLHLNAHSDDETVKEDTKNIPGYVQPAPGTVSNAVRFVGCVSRSLSLPAHSRSEVPCQALVTAAGTYTLGHVALSARTPDGVKFERHLILSEAIMVTDTSPRGDDDLV